MALSYSGTYKRSTGLFSQLHKQIKLLNLKAVKRITVTFDPLHENAVHTRDFLFYLALPKVQATNPSCPLKTEIVCDRRPGQISFQLIPAVAEQLKLKKINFDSSNLDAVELLQLTNKYITAHAPKEEALNVVKTKSEKKAVKKR